MVQQKTQGVALFPNNAMVNHDGNNKANRNC